MLILVRCWTFYAVNAALNIAHDTETNGWFELFIFNGECLDECFRHDRL